MINTRYIPLCLLEQFDEFYAKRGELEVGDLMVLLMQEPDIPGGPKFACCQLVKKTIRFHWVRWMVNDGETVFRNPRGKLALSNDSVKTSITDPVCSK